VSDKFLRDGQIVYVRVKLTRKTGGDGLGDWEATPITKTTRPVVDGEYIYIRKEAIVTQEDMRK
jgi:hypothetical protein